MSKLSFNVVSMIMKCSTIACASKREIQNIRSDTLFFNCYCFCHIELESFFLFIDAYGKTLKNNCILLLKMSPSRVTF